MIILREASVGCAAEAARDERELARDHVVVSALRELRRHANASVALVEIARARDVFEVLRIRAVVRTARTRLTARSFALLQTPTRMHFFQRAFCIVGLGVGVVVVDGKSIGAPADQEHRLAVLHTFRRAENFDESLGRGVIVVGAVGLHMRVAGVEAHFRARDGHGRDCLLAPSRARIVLPRFGSSGIEHDAVERNAREQSAMGRGLGVHFRMLGHVQRV